MVRKEKEIELYLEKKKCADDYWDRILISLKNGESIPHERIGYYMGQCNHADEECLKRGIFPKK